MGAGFDVAESIRCDMEVCVCACVWWSAALTAAAAVFFLAAAAVFGDSGGLAKWSGVAAFSSPSCDSDFFCSSPLVVTTATSGR